MYDSYEWYVCWAKSDTFGSQNCCSSPLQATKSYSTFVATIVLCVRQKLEGILNNLLAYLLTKATHAVIHWLKETNQLHWSCISITSNDAANYVIISSCNEPYRYLLKGSSWRWCIGSTWHSTCMTMQVAVSYRRLCVWSSTLLRVD